MAAAAVVAAAKMAPSSPSDVVANLSEGVIAARERAAQWAKSVLRGLWSSVNPYDDRQVAVFAAKAAKAMASAQTAAGRVAAAAQVKQLEAMGVRVDGAVSIPLDVRAPAARIHRGKLVLQHHEVSVDYADGKAKVSPKEMTTEAVFRRPAEAARYARSVGADPQVAALARMDHLVDDNLMLAQRKASQDVLVQAVDLGSKKRAAVRVLGYRRVIHPEMSRGGTCGLCIVAADRIYRVGELMPIHANCKCTIAAITADHDPGNDVNKADLKKLYEQAGGTSAAHLKRTRYKENAHGELGAVLVPSKPYKPRSEASKKLAGNSAVNPDVVESKADIARRHLPVLEKNLAVLRAAGAAEDSGPIVYHKTQIAKMQADLMDRKSDAGRTDSKIGSVTPRLDSPRPEPGGGTGGPPKPPRNIPPMPGSPDDSYPDMANGQPAPLRPSDIRPVSEDDLRYALDGDGHGAGGHRYGTGIPGQSEFPSHWDEAKLGEAIQNVLFGGDANITLSKDGVVFRALYDDVILAVPVHDYVRYWELASAYPLSGVGVVKNDKRGTPQPVPLKVADLTRSLER